MLDERESKREQLTKIVSGLGEDATPAQIREEAYRVGFGFVHPQMLIFVRSKLWPDRKRRTSGFRLDGKPRTSDLEVQCRPGAILCPECGSSRTRVRACVTLSPEVRRRYRICKDCGHDFKSIEPFAPLNLKPSIVNWAELTEKQCTYCKRFLPVEAFGLRDGSDVVRRPGCKECGADNRAKYIGRDLLKLYGITLEDYQSMLGRQSGCCAICGTNSPFGRLDNNARKRKRRTFSVDHCHATGKVRGLLCGRCNIALGNFEDDTELLRAAIAYIERHRQEADSPPAIPQSE